jgi:predicted alpha/beta hydrolase
VRTPDGAPDTQRIEEAPSRPHSIRESAPAIRFDDDPLVTVAATDRIRGRCADCLAERLLWTRADTGGQSIGHFGFFRDRLRATSRPRTMARIRSS